MAEALMAGDLEGIVRAVVRKARRGDLGAARLVLDRLAPVRRGRPIELDLPSIDDTAGVVAAQSTVVAAIARGEISPEEGEALSILLENRRRAIETLELEQRLASLEAQLAERSNR